MNSIRDILLIQSLDLSKLIEDYREFFLALIPSVFILAIIIEYFDRLDPYSLVKRAVISILVLISVTIFYHQSIDTSMEVADEILQSQKRSNILLMDMFDGIDKWDQLKSKSKVNLYKDKNIIGKVFSFIKYHMFDSFVNDGFTITIIFLTKVCFLILKVVYSLVYYLGYGLIGIPCLIYLFPSMGNVLRGAILSFIWCLIVPHILVFIISMIGTEINQGYIAGQVIGGSIAGTALLFILTLFIAFTPLIGSMILTGSGVSAAGGIIASMGANYVMNLPKNAINSAATVMTGGSLGPKMKMASNAIGGGYKLASNASNKVSSKFKNEKPKVKDTPIGNPVRDVSHISNYLKEAQNNMSTPKIAKNKNVSDLKFTLPIERGNNEKLSKHRRDSSKNSKAISNNRSHKRSIKSSNTNRRNTNKYEKRK